MKQQVLRDNAFEAWATAIHFCDEIKDGKATLQNQKNFVSSLHNAVELIMKQMLLNNNDHRIAEMRKVRDLSDAKLLTDYFQAKDLNLFFDSLSEEDLSKFNTIQFNELISIHKKLLKSCLKQGESLERELKLLQQLRNNETHFLIRQDSFLSEENFLILHNFMIRFYEIMGEWSPVIHNDHESYILPYWGFAYGEETIYEFRRDFLDIFSYETAVRKSKMANKIAEILKDNSLYGAPDFSPFSIAKELVEEHKTLSGHFDEVWAFVYMMQSFKIITVDEILDDECGRVDFYMNITL
jgi:hypothetical protein